MTELQRLTSRQHPLVKRFRTLAMGSHDEGAVLLDGEHVIAEAMDADVRLEVLLTTGAHGDLAARASRAGVRVVEGSASVIDAASPVRSSSGVVAIAHWRPGPLGAVFQAGPALAVGLVAVQDPGNVGSVIRAAHALGGTGVLALDGTAHPAGWKAVRGSMGSLFHVPIGCGTLVEAVAIARSAGIRIIATVASDADTIGQVDLTTPSLVLLGNEGAGLSAGVVASADQRLRIPMQSGANSLNVAVTAALVLFEARRQREGGPSTPLGTGPSTPLGAGRS